MLPGTLPRTTGYRVSSSNNSLSALLLLYRRSWGIAFIFCAKCLQSRVSTEVLYLIIMLAEVETVLIFSTNTHCSTASSSKEGKKKNVRKTLFSFFLGFCKILWYRITTVGIFFFLFFFAICAACEGFWRPTPTPVHQRKEKKKMPETD